MDFPSAGLFFGFAGFAFKEIEPLLDERKKRVAPDLQVMRSDDGFVNFAEQQFVADLFFERRIIFGKETAFALKRLDDALTFEFGVGFGDGIAIDAQFLRQWANGRQRVSRPQGPGSGGITDLIDQLEINWFASLKIDVKHHC
jgi:hypothetical protein